MSVLDFVKTVAGRKFFERQLPELTDAINRVGKALEAQGESKSPAGEALSELAGLWKEQLTSGTPTGMTNATDSVETQDLVAQMQPVFDKMKAEGITVDPVFLAKLKAEANTGIEALDAPAHGLKQGGMWSPPGYKPFKLDESDISSAPQDAKRRALFLALDNWIQTSPDERALVVEHLRDQGEMPATRAATILALFVQFEDTVREALANESSCDEPKA